MTVLKDLLISTRIIIVINLTAFATVIGCGSLQPGNAPIVRFNVSGFTLAAQMAFSEALPVQNLIPTISKSQNAARAFLRDLIMSAVNEVLQEQGRNALLLDSVIQLILQQLNVTIEYMPLNCPTATNTLNNMGMVADVDGCFVIDGDVRSLCADKNACNLMTGMMLKPIPSQHYSLTGSLRTTNVVMASWSRHMWQSVLNRVHRTLTSGRFGRFFNTAIVTVNN